MQRLSSLALLTTLVSGILAAPVEVTIQPVNYTTPAALDVPYNGYATWFDDYRNACKDIQYSFDEPVVAINKQQFDDGSFVCGKYVEVALENTPEATHLYKVVDVCEECSKGSLDFSRKAMSEFTDEGLVKVNWKLVEAPAVADPTTEFDETAGTNTTNTTTNQPAGKSVNARGQKYNGRMTWFSDTSGSCGGRFSQSDMIVAMNEQQMGRKMWGPESRCGQKVRVWNSKTSVTLRIVDTCPKRYCSHGALDLSQAAFRRFAPMSKGVLYLDWEFV